MAASSKESSYFQCSPYHCWMVAAWKELPSRYCHRQAHRQAIVYYVKAFLAAHSKESSLASEVPQSEVLAQSSHSIAPQSIPVLVFEVWNLEEAFFSVT